jgi:hypothetical protein
MSLTHKPFSVFLAELGAYLVAGGSEDDPIAETMQLQVIEGAPGDWRLRAVFDHTIEVVGDESFSTREEAVETIIERIEDGMDPDQICAGSMLQ